MTVTRSVLVAEKHSSPSDLIRLTDSVRLPARAISQRGRWSRCAAAHTAAGPAAHRIPAVSQPLRGASSALYPLLISTAHATQHTHSQGNGAWAYTVEERFFVSTVMMLGGFVQVPPPH